MRHLPYFYDLVQYTAILRKTQTLYFSSSNFWEKWQKIKRVKMEKQRSFGYMWNIIEKLWKFT